LLENKNFLQHCSSFLSYMIILMVQQNYFQICIFKFLDISAKSFFPCNCTLSYQHFIICVLVSRLSICLDYKVISLSFCFFNIVYRIKFTFKFLQRIFDVYFPYAYISVHHWDNINSDYPYRIDQLTYDLQSLNSLSSLAFQLDLILNQWCERNRYNWWWKVSQTLFLFFKLLSNSLSNLYSINYFY